MTPIRLTIVGCFIAVIGLVLSLLDSELWFVGTSVGCLCSAAGTVWSAKRMIRMSFTDYGIEISRRAKELAPVSMENFATHANRATDQRRAFEPFCECPNCGIPTYHLFGQAREQVDNRSIWKAGPGHAWVESDEDVRISVFDKAGTYRVNDRRTGKYVTKKRVTMVVDRECLSCAEHWMETAS